MSRSIIITVAATAATLGTACGGPDPSVSSTAQESRQRFNRGLGFVVDHLDATEKQEKTIRKLGWDLYAHRPGLHSAKTKLRTTFLAEWEKPNPNAENIRVAIDAMMAELTKASKALPDSVVALHRTLTPDQREQIAKHIRDGKRCRHRHGSPFH